jgi:hypothetical protein
MKMRECQQNILSRVIFFFAYKYNALKNNNKYLTHAFLFFLHSKRCLNHFARIS